MLDVDEMVEHSNHRKAYLARYGRQNMLQWDDVPVPYINELYDALAKIVKAENSLSKIVED